MEPTIVIIQAEDSPNEIVLLSTILEGVDARRRVDEVIESYHASGTDDDLIDLLDRVLSHEGFVQPAIYITEGTF